MAKAGGNQASTLSLLEQKDYDKIKDNENGFPWMLVQNREELEKFWPSAVLSTIDPSVAVPINPEFQISKPSWTGFTFHSTFYALNTSFF